MWACWELDAENLYILNIIKLHMTKSGRYDRYTLKYTKEKAFKVVFTIYFNEIMEATTFSDIW